MAIIRIQTWGEGGVNPDLPYDNLVMITDVDEETGEKTEYGPPFENIPPLPDPEPVLEGKEKGKEVPVTVKGKHNG